MNTLEEMLYPSPHFSEMKKQSKVKHPYSHGLYLSINHNCKREEEVSKQYHRIYRIVFSTFTGKVLIPQDIRTEHKIPTTKKAKELLRRNIPLMTSALHKFPYEKKYSNGDVVQSHYFHSHHYLYRMENLMPKSVREMNKKVEELRLHIQEYISTTSSKHLLVKVQAVGQGENINDRVTDETLYDYLKSASGNQNNLMTYFKNKSVLPVETDLSYTYTD